MSIVNNKNNVFNTNLNNIKVMTKIKEGAAPMSKYAAKKAKRVEESNDESKVVTNTHKVNKKNYTPNFPEHIVNVALLIKNNAEIRRFTSKGIINYLSQKHEINGEHKYVSFKWDKFSVIVDGLAREYKYTEPFFLNCLVAAFSSFAASAQITINEFTRIEMSIGVEKAVDTNEVQRIVDDTFKDESK